MPDDLMALAAFPSPDERDALGNGIREGSRGMTLRDWFAGQALANPQICTGTAPEYQLEAWFGGRIGIKRAEIVAMQAGEYADAMLRARASQSGVA